MKKLIIYVHGKGGSADEAEHYKHLFTDSDVIGFDYQSQNPWEAKEEFPKFLDLQAAQYESVILIANSIGAFFCLSALSDKQIDKAFFISPIVHMEKLIGDMMLWANVHESELAERKEIKTDFGEILSWDYLCYVREHPIEWNIPTYILYGERDNLTSLETVSEFAKQVDATLIVMQNGEHWFHTEEQMEFLDRWIRRSML